MKRMMKEKQISQKEMTKMTMTTTMTHLVPDRPLTRRKHDQRKEQIHQNLLQRKNPRSHKRRPHIVLLKSRKVDTHLVKKESCAIFAMPPSAYSTAENAICCHALHAANQSTDVNVEYRT